MQPNTDAALLVVRVQPRAKETGRTPYALKKKGGWHFLRRVGARNHPMSREEIFSHAVSMGQDQAVENAIRKLVETRQAFRDSGRDGLWLGLQPARSLDLQLSQERQRFARIAVRPGDR